MYKSKATRKSYFDIFTELVDTKCGGQFKLTAMLNFFFVIFFAITRMR
jgi:hypothetical protein